MSSVRSVGIMRGPRFHVVESARSLRACAEKIQPTSETFAADLTQAADTLDIMAHRIARLCRAVEATDPRPRRHRLVVTGGTRIPDTLDPELVEDLAATLEEVAARMRRVRRSWPRVVLVAQRARQFSALRRAAEVAHVLIGRDGAGHIMAWCERRSAELAGTAGIQTPPVVVEARRRRALTAEVTGFVAGAITPIVVWAAIEGLARLVWRLGTHPVGWLLALAGYLGLAPTRQATVQGVGWLGQYFTTRWPLAADVMLSHTLPWWQGYVSGWNTTRLLWDFVSPYPVGMAQPVPAMERPETPAALNASIVTWGASRDLFDDSYVVATAPPVLLDPVELTLPKLVEMGDEIMAHGDGADQSNLECSIRIATFGSGEDFRMVVIIPGTQTFAARPVANPYSMTQNMHLMAYGVASNSRAVRRAVLGERRRLGVPHEAVVPLMLYGHSQGGLLAAQLSRRVQFLRRHRVTHVVTTGAPIAGRPFPTSTRYLAVEHDEDVIPKLDLTINPDLPGVVTVRTTIIPWGERQRILDVHRWVQYRDTMERIVESDHPVLRRAVAGLSPYVGRVATLADYPQVRVLPDR